jgi:hypothetical protein
MDAFIYTTIQQICKGLIPPEEIKWKKEIIKGRGGEDNIKKRRG